MSNQSKPPRKNRKSLRSAFTNMALPIPWHRKLYLLTRNLGKRLVTGSSCCGNHGEPGC